ncbi:MAG: ABC transporter permease [Polyangiaceae bacterium]|nr:ABC transporter permease [Polyangiaceae bacterium]
MSLARALKASPTLFRVGFAGAVAYRAELLVWMLSTTTPFVMLALFSAVAAEQPIGNYDQRQLGLYFIATFIVRQLTGSWAAWEINFEVRQGTLSVRLLRPVHPIIGYAIENLAAIPLRLIIVIPVVVGAIAYFGAGWLPSSAVKWAAFAAAALGGWLITYLINVAIGSLSLYIESSVKVLDVYLVLFFVFSGYTIPVDLFPGWLATLGEWLPFRYQIALPVQILTSAHDTEAVARELVRQWAFVVGLLVTTSVLWQRAIRRYGAFGG